MSDRLNTIFGWVLGSGVIALGLSSISGKVFHADKVESPEEPGYFIEAADEAGGADAGPSLAMLMSGMAPSAGEAIFAKCIACHTIEQGGAAGIGPNLFGVVGQPIGKHAAGFAYSGVLAEHGGEWNFENLDAWLKSPRAFANGTKMSFAGLSSIEDRAAVIVYLNSMGSNLPLPEVVEPVAEAAEGDAEAETDDVAAEEAVAGVEASADEEAAATE